MSKKISMADNMMVVKIYNSDMEQKTMSKGGIITAHTLKPTLDYCQIGECIEVGNSMSSYVKSGDMVLFNWFVENDNEAFIERDETGEYRFVTERQLYGTVKTNKKTGHSHVQPKKLYVIAEPQEEDFTLTKSVFQIPITSVNPTDKVLQDMKIKVGDWIICLPYSAVPITIKRKVLWFIYIFDIMCVNDGQHKVAINRKKVYENLRLSSRKEKVNLN